MASVDVFVFLCHCQFEKGKYQNRFRLRDQWFTMSVNHGLEPINRKRYVQPQEDWEKIKRRLPEYRQIFTQIEGNVSQGLCWTNCNIIKKLTELLGITTRIEFDSECGLLKGTDRLISICKQFGGDTYLAGQSGASYMEPDKFTDAGIKIEYQDLSKADTRHTLEVLHERL